MFLCREGHGWPRATKRKFKATTHSNHGLPVAENLLKQEFSTQRANQVWVTDITYIPTREGWLYLAGIKDLHTCEIVGYALGERMTKELVSRALFGAVVHKRPPPGLIHHSDRGSQYCAHDYRRLLDQFGMRCSMSRKGNCYDNAPMDDCMDAGGPLPRKASAQRMKSNAGAVAEMPARYSQPSRGGRYVMSVTHT